MSAQGLVPRTVIALALALMILAPLTPGSAVEADTFTLIGDDPAGDSFNYVAPGADADAVVTSDRTDILSLSSAVDGDILYLKLGLTVLPAGSSGYMYAVFFDVGGTSYFTCYGTQWIGGAASVENVKSCSRFQEGTQVGAEIVGGEDEVSSGEPGVILEDGGFITWPVPLAAIGAAAGDEMTAVRAETWFRGVSDCCVGSQTDSQYYWNQADVAPDADAWTAMIGDQGALPLPDLALTVDKAPSFVTAGEQVTINATLAASDVLPEGNHTITSTIAGVDWTVTLAPETITLTPNNASTPVTLFLDIPSDFEAGDVNVTWTLCYADPPASEDENATGPACGTATLAMSVFEAPEPTLAPNPEAEAAPAEAEAEEPEAPKEESLPAPGFAIVVGALAALAVAARRRI